MVQALGQKRFKAGAATLLIKVKAHRGDPVNEEVDIRAEMGRMKEEKEKAWNVPTNRTINQWSEVSKTKTETLITKQSAWAHHESMPHQKGPITSESPCPTRKGQLRQVIPPTGSSGRGKEGETRGIDEDDLGKTLMTKEACCMQLHIASRPTHGSTKLRRIKNEISVIYVKPSG